MSDSDCPTCSKTSLAWAETVCAFPSSRSSPDPPIGFPRSSAGTYGSGPLHGRLVDARGPKPSLVIAFFTLSIGYLGTKMIFDAGLKEGQERASTATVVLLIICGFLTGNGGSGGLTGALNTVAKSFPERIVSVRDVSDQFCAYADSLIHPHREPALQGWYCPASGCQLSCSPRSHIHSSPGTPPTSSSCWQSVPRCR